MKETDSQAAIIIIVKLKNQKIHTFPKGLSLQKKEN